MVPLRKLSRRYLPLVLFVTTFLSLQTARAQTPSGWRARPTVEAHLDRFISVNGLAGLTARVVTISDLGASTERREMATAFARNFYRLVVSSEGRPTALQRVDGSNAQQQAFVDSVLLPHLQPGSTIVRIAWHLKDASVETYAIVKAKAMVGDLNAIIEPIIGTFRRHRFQGLGSFHQSFENMLGFVVAEYFCDVSVSCSPEGQLITKGDVSAWDAGPLCSAQSRKNLEGCRLLICFRPTPAGQTLLAAMLASNTSGVMVCCSGTACWSRTMDHGWRLGSVRRGAGSASQGGYGHSLGLLARPLRLPSNQALS